MYTEKGKGMTMRRQNVSLKRASVLLKQNKTEFSTFSSLFQPYAENQLDFIPINENVNV